MTIKEIETLSGLPRANIRYYESEGLIAPGVYLKTPNAPGQRTFSRCAAPFFLEIRQYACEKMSCSAQKFLAAGHIGSFQIHPKRAENGYREYSQADAEVLLRVKLLRALGLRIDTIKSLAAGTLMLGDALDARLEELQAIRSTIP